MDETRLFHVLDGSGRVIERLYTGDRKPLLQGYTPLIIFPGGYNYRGMKVGDTVRFSGTTMLRRVS